MFEWPYRDANPITAHAKVPNTKTHCIINRAVASLTVLGGQEFHFTHFSSKFDHFFLFFPQTLLIFFLILALRVGESPIREGPGYATDYQSSLATMSFVGFILQCVSTL